MRIEGTCCMALRREDLTPEQLERQRGLDESYAHGLRLWADPEWRATVRESLRRLDAEPPAPRVSRDEFLAATAHLDKPE